MSHKTRRRAFASCSQLLAIVLFAVLPVAAQTNEPSVTFGAGAGTGHSFHGDFNYYAPAWEAELAFHSSRRVAVEIGFGHWRRVKNEVFTDVPFGPVNGVIGRVDRIDQRTALVNSALDVNVTAGGSVGGVRISGGGGGGLETFQRTFRTTLTGCSLSIPAACETDESTFSSISPIVQALGRMEFPAGGRVKAYVAGRFWVNLRDVGSSGVRFTGGIRIGI